MAGIRKIDHQSLRPANAPRTEPTRDERGRKEDFDSRLGGTNKLVPYQTRTLERTERDAAGLTTEENWLRERTLEELRTIVQALQVGITDPKELTDLIFYARHPEMLDVPLTREHQALLDEWNQISALQVHPVLNEASDLIGANLAGGEVRGVEAMQTAFDRAFASPAKSANIKGGATERYDEVIARAVEWCPGLSPAILKSLLAQESNFNPTVVNQYGYAGIAQFGREAAREVGLKVGVAGTAMDERLDPSKAIPGAARLLNIKAQRLGEMAFSRYGQPTGVEFWKFVLAAYNGGEGTVTVAMGHAYRAGMAQARAKGLAGTAAVSFARTYASQWENLKAGGLNSPLAQATSRYFPDLAAAKYHEIGNYPTAIVARVKGA
ncbi:MAG TPA: transglycosylase SLT domain-containing protein [Pyrinomonadaceae bacterium]|jgi:soluble lytic murein transglycosylase-like protein